MVLKILASVFTGIGGHYLNRRWDKAILFCCLFVLYITAVFLAYWYMLSNMALSSPEGFGELIKSYEQWLKRLISIGIFAIWLVSIVVTFVDIRKGTEPNLNRWTVSGTTGAVLTSILSMLILFYAASASYSSVKTQDYEESKGATETTYYESNTFGPPGHNFYTGLYFGGEPRKSNTLPAPPAGDSVLKGQITYQGQPAEGVSLSVVLNEKYKVADLVTDSTGIFTINLEPGKWRINSLKTQNWENRPSSGEFSMYYGGEAKLSGDKYNPYKNWMRGGYEVEVGSDPATVHLKAFVSDDIRIVWPGPKINAADATIDDSINWASYPRAARYYVGLSKVTQKGSSTFYSPITGKVVEAGATSLPLAGLKHRTTASSGKSTYSVKIFAFAEDNSLVGAYSKSFQGGTFTLPEGVVLIEDEIEKEFGLSDIDDQDEFEKKYAAISANDRKETAVSVLIDEGMLKEADKLIGQMDSEYSRGRKEVMSGYLLALKEDCDGAAEMFNKATDINVDVCIPDKYWVACGH